MRAVRIFGTWMTVVVAVVGWILFVPVINLLGSLFNRLSGLAGAGPYGQDASLDAGGLETKAGQPTYSKEHGKQAA